MHYVLGINTRCPKCEREGEYVGDSISIKDKMSLLSYMLTISFLPNVRLRLALE